MNFLIFTGLLFKCLISQARYEDYIHDTGGGAELILFLIGLTYIAYNQYKIKKLENKDYKSAGYALAALVLLLLFFGFRLLN